MPHFPLFIDLNGQPVLVVGGGAVALRKLQKLAPYGAKPTVVAPEISPEIAVLPGVTLRRRAFRVWDLHPRPALVIAATDDPAVNHRISALCQKRHIPVNVADDPGHCTFLFPALVQQGRFSAGISTGGASPTAAAHFKAQLQSLLPERLDELLDWLEAQRPAVKAAISEQSERSAAFRRLCHACLEKGAPLTEAETSRCVAGDGAPVGSVALVGAGCGKADLITLRGLRLLQQCQAVVYDDLIDPALLDAVPESARKIYMGKRSGAHSAPQEEINRTLIALAREGLQVVRLKGGDPYLFGRGGEEMLALKAAGIPCREVPGVPSAIGIPAEYGIPVTHRGMSQGLHIVTGHTAGTPDGLPTDFDRLATLSGTLVFLMGLQQLPRIVSRLIAAGKPGDTPAAVLSGGNAPHPTQVRAPLCELAAAASAADVTAPAIILVGNVAALDLREP
ncbi:MAG: siroheme synthase CysG [Candidatus Onthomonas sp.]